jgi:hypothetical protein
MSIKVGDYIRSPRLGLCEIVRVLPLSTVDVRAIESDRYFRISGLALTPAATVQPRPGSNDVPTVFVGA